MIYQKYELTKIRKAFIEILINLWKISKTYIAFSIFSIIASSSLLVLAPYIFSTIIDSYTGNKEDLIIKNIFQGFLIYSILIGLSLVFKNTITYLSLVISQNVNYIAATSFFKKIIKKKSIFFIKHNPTEIQAIQKQGAQAVDILIQLMLMIIIPGIVQIVFSTALLGSKIDNTIILTVSIYGLFL